MGTKERRIGVKYMEGYLEFKESSKVNNGSCCRDVYNFTVLLLSRKPLSRVILFARPRLEKKPIGLVAL